MGLTPKISVLNAGVYCMTETFPVSERHGNLFPTRVKEQVLFLISVRQFMSARSLGSISVALLSLTSIPTRGKIPG